MNLATRNHLDNYVCPLKYILCYIQPLSFGVKIVKISTYSIHYPCITEYRFGRTGHK